MTNLFLRRKDTDIEEKKPCEDTDKDWSEFQKSRNADSHQKLKDKETMPKVSQGKEITKIREETIR